MTGRAAPTAEGPALAEVSLVTAVDADALDLAPARAAPSPVRAAPRCESPSGREGGSHSGQSVRSLVRALSILNRVAQCPGGASLTEIAQCVRLSTSTTHRLLVTLEELRYVRFDPASRFWMIGVQSFVIGSSFTKARSLIDIARPHMRALMEKTAETVNLAVLDSGKAVVVGQVECRQLMRALASPGRRVPLHCSAAGKAMLAALSEDDVAQALQRCGLPRFTATTLTTMKRLTAELEAVAERGYAVDNEEHSLGVRCVGAVIFDEHRDVAGAISVSGPSVRVTREHVAELGRLVGDAAAAITAAYGGAARPPREPRARR